MRYACVLALLLTACTAENAKEVTSKAVGKAVELSKGTAKGIAQGAQEGREASESVDGAKVVSTMEALKKVGGVSIMAVRPADGNPKQAAVDLAFENTGDQPLRVTKLDLMGLDKEGFAKKALRGDHELTVPNKAKAKLTVIMDVPADELATLRIYGEDFPVPAAK